MMTVTCRLSQTNIKKTQVRITYLHTKRIVVKILRPESEIKLIFLKIRLKTFQQA